MMKPLSRRRVFGLALAAPVASVVRRKPMWIGVDFGAADSTDVPWARDPACDELLERLFCSSFSSSVITPDGEFHYSYERLYDGDDLAPTLRRIWNASTLGIGESDDDGP